VGLLETSVLAGKDMEEAIADRAARRDDERRWCREGKLPKPGWRVQRKKGELGMTVLEKVKLLERYIAADVAAIDPVVELAIEKLLKREASRMDELKQRLLRQKAEFEEKYGLNSEEFCRRYEKGMMGDDMDYVEWSATVDMLAGIERRLSLLQQKASA
jgi:hypothetical protein